MARPGLINHRKFKLLARLIGDRAKALGHLEFLWAAAYENGDEFLGGSDEVEALAEWDGEPGELLKYMLKSGFIDQNGKGFMVHDLWDHAPDYVRKRRERELTRQKKGEALERSLTGQCPGSDRSVDPPPAPAPAPSSQGTPLSPPTGGPVADRRFRIRELTPDQLTAYLSRQRDRLRADPSDRQAQKEAEKAMAEFRRREVRT